MGVVRGGMRSGDRLPRRRTDVVEDVVVWLLMVCGLIGVLVAVLVGWGVDAGALDRGRLEAATRTRVDAVLLVDAPVLIGEGAGATGPVYVAARWVGPDGGARSGPVPADPGSAAGSTVRIWTDRGGAVVHAPAGPVDAAFLGVACGLGLLAGIGGLLGLLWAGGRRLIDIRNADAWQREWERVGPRWSGGAG